MNNFFFPTYLGTQPKISNKTEQRKSVLPKAVWHVVFLVIMQGTGFYGNVQILDSNPLIIKFIQKVVVCPQKLLMCFRIFL
jgi:hypothetical protein